jgi:hypothetical protein
VFALQPVFSRVKRWRSLRNKRDFAGIVPVPLTAPIAGVAIGAVIVIADTRAITAPDAFAAPIAVVTLGA